MKLKSIIYPSIFLIFTGLLASFNPQEAPKQTKIIYGQADPNEVMCLKDTSNNKTSCYKVKYEEPKVEPSAPIVAQPSTDPKDIAFKRVCETWGEDQWAAFDKLITKESGWNINAVNKSSGACGLGQALPCSKLGDARGNPSAEIDWIITYINNRYGNPVSAWNFHLNHNWY